MISWKSYWPSLSSPAYWRRRNDRAEPSLRDRMAPPKMPPRLETRSASIAPASNRSVSGIAPCGQRESLSSVPPPPALPGRLESTMRQPIESVSVPRVSLTVEREGGTPAQRTIVHDGELCKIG